jgi:hypothetical protein
LCSTESDRRHRKSFRFFLEAVHFDSVRTSQRK